MALRTAFWRKFVKTGSSSKSRLGALIRRDAFKSFVMPCKSSLSALNNSTTFSTWCLPVEIENSHRRNLFLNYTLLRHNSNGSDCSLKKHDTHDENNTESIVDLQQPNLNQIDSLHQSIVDELRNDMLVFEDFLAEEEDQSLLSEIEPYMKKLRYEYDHWDDAIHGYRETEKKHWNDENQKIIQRVRDLAFSPDVPSNQLAYVHILDLEKSGYIKAHVDSVRFCGSTITGMSLLSDSVMKLTHEKNSDEWANVLLKRRSLYIMKGAARYDYSHSILADKESFFKNQRVPRDRRISVICRNEAADLNGFPETSNTTSTDNTKQS